MRLLISVTSLTVAWAVICFGESDVKWVAAAFNILASFIQLRMFIGDKR